MRAVVLCVPAMLDFVDGTRVRDARRVADPRFHLGRPQCQLERQRGQLPPDLPWVQVVEQRPGMDIRQTRRSGRYVCLFLPPSPLPLCTPNLSRPSLQDPHPPRRRANRVRRAERPPRSVHASERTASRARIGGGTPARAIPQHCADHAGGTRRAQAGHGGACASQCPEAR
jgi:hypothetical protein